MKTKNTKKMLKNIEELQDTNRNLHNITRALVVDLGDALEMSQWLEVTLCEGQEANADMEEIANRLTRKIKMIANRIGVPTEQ